MKHYSFLCAILARPRDDGPRLVYADFLDESDGPADRGRADLIRTQCALARLGDDHPRLPSLVQRQTDLLQQFQAEWAEPLRGLADGVVFRRGLLDAVSLDAATFLSHGDELFRRAPVRRVRLANAARFVAELADCPHLSQVRELDLTDAGLGNGGVCVLTRSPHLCGVETLDLSFNGLGDAGVRHFANAATLPRLRELVLTDNNGLGSDGLRDLAESPYRGGLTALDVSANDIDGEGVRAVAGSRTLSRLHTFRVAANPVGDAGAAALAGSDLLARMLARSPWLDLRLAALGPAGARALAASERLRAAVGLDLSDNHIGDDGLAALAHSPRLARLRRLAVRRNGIGDAGAVALARSQLMARLAALDVSANRLTRRGVDELWARRPDWKTALEIGGNVLAEVAPAAGPPHVLEPAVGRVRARVTTPRSPSGRPTSGPTGSARS